MRPRLLILWLAFAGLLSSSVPTLASEEVHDLQPEKLFLTLSFGYGISYANNMLVSGGILFDLDPSSAYLLESLGLDLSDNVYTSRLTATYAFTPRLGAYTVFPTGLVQERSDRMLPGLELDDLEPALGDASVGLYYRAFQESGLRPGVILFLDLNSNFSHFSSLGNGLWDISAGASLPKTISRSFAVTADLDYTHSFSRGGIDPGSIFGVGARLRWLFKGGALELGLKDVRASEYRVGGFALTESDDDLVLTFEFWPRSGSLRAFERSSLKAYLTSLDEGFNFRKNIYGFRWSFPILIR